MPNKPALSIALAAAAAALCLAPAHPAQATTADEYFSDGNRLFRDDLYWAALLRYRQAAGEGMDTALLHYNSGVAHYRAGQHIRAREALQTAAADPTLMDVARYNLGLNAYALGETDEALRWFRLVRDQNRDETLQEYAVVAIARIRLQLEQPDEFEIRAEERKKKREFTDLELSARVSFGQDDNVFRSPDQPYVDLSDPAQPLVVPNILSGAYMPVALSAKYRINSLPFEGFYVRYRLGGRYYQDQDLENANEYQHEASFGSEYRRKEGSREREVWSAFKSHSTMKPTSIRTTAVRGRSVAYRSRTAWTTCATVRSCRCGSHTNGLRSAPGSKRSYGTTRSPKDCRNTTTSFFS